MAKNSYERNKKYGTICDLCLQRTTNGLFSVKWTSPPFIDFCCPSCKMLLDIEELFRHMRVLLVAGCIGVHLHPRHKQ
jgi:hypothetical protein